MKQWYELEQSERIKDVFSKHTIKEFWDWWSNGEPKVMEIRIKDFKIIKQVSERLGIPYSASGVYVNNAVHLKNVIAIVRDFAVLWFGFNPRKKNWNKWGNKTFGGSNYNVESIDFIFIDIDRVIKAGQANNKDLEHSEMLIRKLLEKLATENWANEYCKICSGNGAQLLIKLDYPIKVPGIEFDSATKTYVENDAYQRIIEAIRTGIGQQMLKFCGKFKDELGVELDKSCFKIAGVGALPFTKNYKFGGFTWRGIVELKKEEKNEGLTDYLLNTTKDATNIKTIFVKSRTLASENRFTAGKLRQHKLIKFFMENQFPEGNINNTVWFQIKILIRECNIDMRSKEFIKIHAELKKIHSRDFSLNIPEKKFQFSEDTVNAFCIRHLFPPLYKVVGKRGKRLNMRIDDIKYNWCIYANFPVILDEETTIQEDLTAFKTCLKENDYNNVDRVSGLIKACVKKYGEERTIYYVKHLFYRWLSYS